MRHACFLTTLLLLAAFPLASADPCTNTDAPPPFTSPPVGTEEVRFDQGPVHLVIDPVPILPEGEVETTPAGYVHHCAYTEYPVGVTFAVVPEGADCTLQYQYLATFVMPITGSPRYDFFLVSCVGDMAFVGVVGYPSG